MCEEFQVDVPPNRYKEMYELVEEKGEECIKEFPLVDNLKRVNDNLLSSLINRGWKAQMSVIGSSGLP